MISQDVKKESFVVDKVWSYFLRKHARLEGRVKSREVKY